MKIVALVSCCVGFFLLLFALLLVCCVNMYYYLILVICFFVWCNWWNLMYVYSESFLCVKIFDCYLCGRPHGWPQTDLPPADEGKEWQRIPTNPCSRYLQNKQPAKLIPLPFLDPIFSRKIIQLTKLF